MRQRAICFLLQLGIASVLFTPLGNQPLSAEDNRTQGLRPYDQNPRYWQYKGEPVMLLGGSATDHIFLLEGLEAHLDEIQSVGANYVRCTMSQRESTELKPHRLLASGKFDLDQWNKNYWQRFENMLKWTDERDIFVQIEVWDRFDYSRDLWEHSPWNPDNNVTYTKKQSSLATDYPEHPSKDKQPFFHSIKGMPKYNAKLELIRKYQEAFVDKMLSYSLKHGHVIYCMNNETSTPAQWGQHWIDQIKNAAAEKGISVCTTDMFDDAHKGREAVHTPIIYSDPDHYDFADISQVNSRNFDRAHWDALDWLLNQVDRHPRPSNHTKIYGSGYLSFGTGGPEDGVERFWRNILAGSAAVRFHRPPAGNGLNDFAKGSIKAARIVESKVNFWDVEPHMELVSENESNEAYLAAKPGDSYALYFTNGGSVTLNLTDAPGAYEMTWISVSLGITTDTWKGGDWRKLPKTLKGGAPVTLNAPYKGGWVVTLTKRRVR